MCSVLKPNTLGLSRYNFFAFLGVSFATKRVNRKALTRTQPNCTYRYAARVPKQGKRPRHPGREILATSLECAGLPQSELVAFEEILKQPGAKEAWAKLNAVSEFDHRAVKRRLEVLACGTPSDQWHPPVPRDARRLAALLLKVAPKIGRMNIYFSSALPLGNPNFLNLPKVIEQYAGN